jgi:hypothetical protein
MRRHDTYSRPFRPTGQAKSNPLRFVGTMNRNHVTVSELVLARCAEDNRFAFEAAGSPVSFPGITNPVPIALFFGNVSGTTSVKALIAP